MPELKEFIGYGPTVLILALLGFLALRLAPTVQAIVLALADRWKEVALRRLEMQDKLSQTVGTFGEPLREIALEQRRRTDAIEVLQRITDEDVARIKQEVTELKERIQGEKK